MAGKTYGRTNLSPVAGIPVQVSADGQPDWKAIGITLDWSLIAAVSGSDVTIESEGTVIKVGKKYLRYGQVLCKVTQAEVSTVDFSGDDDPTGGDVDLNIAGTTFEGDTFSVDLDAVAWNVTAAALQALIRALSFPGASKVTVSKSSFVYTITFPPESGNIVITSPANAFTGGVGDTFLVSIGTTTQGVVNAGYYGPYDPAATDGRQTLSRGNCYILNMTVIEDGLSDISGGATNHPAVFDGGLVFKLRVLATTGTHSLAAGPTYTELETAFPRLSYAGD